MIWVKSLLCYYFARINDFTREQLNLWASSQSLPHNVAIIPYRVPQYAIHSNVHALCMMRLCMSICFGKYSSLPLPPPPTHPQPLPPLHTLQPNCAGLVLGHGWLSHGVPWRLDHAQQWAPPTSVLQRVSTTVQPGLQLPWRGLHISCSLPEAGLEPSNPYCKGLPSPCVLSVVVHCRDGSVPHFATLAHALHRCLLLSRCTVIYCNQYIVYTIPSFLHGQH